MGLTLARSRAEEVERVRKLKGAEKARREEAAKRQEELATEGKEEVEQTTSRCQH